MAGLHESRAVRFSEEQLAKIAEWEIAHPDFETVDPIRGVIVPAFEHLASSSGFTWQFIDNGLFSNFCSAVVHQALTKQEVGKSRHHKPHRGDALMVYLSLVFPVAAIGPTRYSVASGSYGASRFELSDVLDPLCGDDAMLTAIQSSFQGSPYRFLGRSELSQSLPPHIRPHEYCLFAEPWDRVFHVLFSHTD